MSNSDLIILKRAYDFTKWLFNHTNKFPKSFRFSIASRLENSMLEFIELVTVANKRKDKIPMLKKADEALAKIRILFRLSYDLKFINLKSYEFGSGKISELGRMLGGWIKSPTK